MLLCDANCDEAGHNAPQPVTYNTSQLRILSRDEMPEAAPQGGLQGSGISSVSDRPATYEASFTGGYTSEARSSYEIFSSAIGELSKQNLNNSQYIDQIRKNN